MVLERCEDREESKGQNCRVLRRRRVPNTIPNFLPLPIVLVGEVIVGWDEGATGRKVEWESCEPILSNFHFRFRMPVASLSVIWWVEVGG